MKHSCPDKCPPGQMPPKQDICPPEQMLLCCVTTAAQHQTFSVRHGVPLAGRVAGHATSRLWQRNTCWASLVPAPLTSVGAQRRRQTDTPIFSVRARHMLRDLHWLRSPERIDFKLAVLVYRCQHGLCLLYTSPSPRDRQKSRMPSSA